MLLFLPCLSSSPIPSEDPRDLAVRARTRQDHRRIPKISINSAFDRDGWGKDLDGREAGFRRQGGRDDLRERISEDVVNQTKGERLGSPPRIREEASRLHRRICVKEGSERTTREAREGHEAKNRSREVSNRRSNPWLNLQHNLRPWQTTIRTSKSGRSRS